MNDESIEIHILIRGRSIFSPRDDHLERMLPRRQTVESLAGLPDDFRAVEVDIPARDSIDFNLRDSPIEGLRVDPGNLASFER